MTVLHIAVMALTFLYMFNKAHFAQTRMVALVPLLMLVADGCTAGVSFFAVPVLGVLMECARVVVLVCCGVAMKRDTRLYAAQKKRRLLREMQARTTALAKEPCAVADAPCFA